MNDRAGRSYWDDLWSKSRAGPAAAGQRSWVHRRVTDYKWRFVGYFEEALAAVPTKDRPYIEIGCADSLLLPWFSKRFGFQVTGLDYSPQGCLRAERRLAESGVPGRVVCADLFRPPGELTGRFDVLGAFGLVEHFHDIEGCLRALAAFLRPGGLMLLTMPNLAGPLGWMQKWCCRRIWDIHVIWTRQRFSEAVQRAGMELIDCRYHMALDFHLCILDESSTAGWSRWFRKGTHRFLAACGTAVMLFDLVSNCWPAGRWTSSYLMATARKKA